MGSKLPATAGECIYKGERHDYGAAAPFSTTTSSLQRRAGDSTFSPKVVELVGPSWIHFVEILSPRIACTAVAAPSLCSRVLVSAGPSAFMARRGCRASCSRLATRWLLLLKSSVSYSSLLFDLSKSSSTVRYISASVSWADPNSSCWGTGPLPSGTGSLSFHGMLE